MHPRIFEKLSQKTKYLPQVFADRLQQKSVDLKEITVGWLVVSKPKLAEVFSRQFPLTY